MALTKITLDFETFYSKEYSLSRLTTEEYIRDPRFEVIGVGVKVNDGETEWASGDHVELQVFLLEFDWDNAILVCQNTAFDGAILYWVFGIRPKIYADTMCMSRAWDGVHVSASLAKQAERRLGKKKGTEVISAIGMQRKDFTELGLSNYGDYCINDAELTYELFMQYLKGGFPIKELKVIDLTLRMFIQPKLELDLLRLESHLHDVSKRKEDLLIEAGVDKKDLMSNNKFAALLRELDIEPPTKISVKTGKEAYAFARTDEGFKALLEHDDDRVQTLANARLGNKSTLEESRAERFISIAKRGILPVPIKYYGAHTGRWSGQDKINLQNLPSRGPNGKKLKNTIRAPKGYVCVEADLAQIEARIVAWLAGQTDLVDAFARGEDVYKLMASKIYNVTVEEVTEAQRFIGKMTILGCIAEGTPVLCKGGWKPIEEVTDNDKLWDGDSWVCHKGLVPKGYKETLSVCGSWLTPDHKILCGEEWVEAGLVAQNESTLSLALERGAVNLPSQVTLWDNVEDSPLLSSDVVAGYQSILSTSTTLSLLSLQDAIYVLKNLLTTPAKCTGSMQILSPMTTNALAYSTESRPPYPDVTTRKINTSGITVGEGFTFRRSGAKTELSSSNTLLPVRIGITQSLKWIGSTTIEGMRKGMYALFQGHKTCETNGKYKSYRRRLMTYDVAYAGQNNRFTIWTEEGPMIVHNCGYGMGADRFKAQIKAMGNVDIPLDESRMIVQTYRSSNFNIKKMWAEANRTIEYLCRGDEVSFGKIGILDVDADRKALILPNLLPMYYNGLHVMSQGDYGPEYGVKTRKGVEKIYGGKVVENACQALAKLVIADQMILIGKKYHVALTVHDSMVALVPEEEADDGAYYVYTCLRHVPAWAKGLPLDCDVGYHKYYGSCGDNTKAITKQCAKRWASERTN